MVLDAIRVKGKTRQGILGHATAICLDYITGKCLGRRGRVNSHYQIKPQWKPLQSGGNGEVSAKSVWFFVLESTFSG